MADETVRLRALIDAATGIFCHLLEIGTSKLIIDCGIGETFDYSLYDACKETIASADCIIITSFDLKHIGALGLFPNVPCYCSAPTAVLGTILLDDMAYKLKTFHGREILPAINPKQVKFSQVFQINDIEVSAYNAGNCLGNSIFRFTFGLQSVVLGYNINQRKENYLDGLSSNAIGHASIFITNSAYCAVRPYSLKSEDEKLQQMVKGCRGKTVINVKFTRLIELLCVLAGEKVIVISKYGKNFINRIKSMIEWAGTRATDIFSDFRCTFGKVSDAKEHSIIVLVNESSEGGVFGSVLDAFNKPENQLILNDQKASDINFSGLGIYKFSYTLEEKTKHSEHAKPKDEKDSVYGDDETAHWTKTPKTLFVDKQAEKKLFPALPRKIYNNDYGETVKFTFEKQVESAIKDYQNNEAVEVESVELVKRGIVPSFKIAEFLLYGISDYSSSMTVLDSFDPEQVVIVNDFQQLALFYCTALRLKSKGYSVDLCDREVCLRSKITVYRATLSAKILELRYVKLGGKHVAKCIVRRSGEIVEAVGDYDSILLGSVSLPLLRKALTESGFQVRVKENELTVDNSLKILLNSNQITVEAGEADLLAGVRNVLYKFLTIL